MSDAPATPKRRIRGRMPARVIVTVRFVPTETNTWAPIIERAALRALADQAKAVAHA